MSLCYDFKKWTMISTASIAISLTIGIVLVNYGYGEELKILESQLNENSISGILVNEYDYPISGIIVRAEFYDKEDGHLVGVRDIGWSSKDPLGPKEESSYKIPEFDDEGQGPFPNTNFIVKAQGYHDTIAEEVEEGEGGLFVAGLIEDLSKVEQGLANITKEYKNNAGLIEDLSKVEQGLANITKAAKEYKNQ